MRRDGCYVPELRILSDDALERLHLATLDVLQRTGVHIECEEALRLLQDAGCWVDGPRARIPAHLVDWAVRVAPTRVVLSTRDRVPSLYLEDGRAYFGLGGGVPKVLDLDGCRRPATVRDVADFARLADALSNIDFVESMSTPQDVTSTLADLYEFEAMVANTSKPILWQAYSVESLETIVQMCEIVAGGTEQLQRCPFAIPVIGGQSPLYHGSKAMRSLLHVAARGIPFVFAKSATIGVQAPVTLAGTLVLTNAEMLSALVVAQLTRKGVPFIRISGHPVFDMSRLEAIFNGPEFLLNMVAGNEMARYYGLPIFSYGGCSDAKTVDQQAGIEGALLLLAAALSGGNLIHDIGFLELLLTSSYEMLVVMDEMAGWVKRVLDGIRIDREHLALDLIDSVGPLGEFLSTEHTLRHFRGLWHPGLLDRTSYEIWKNGGGMSLGQRANEKARKLLDKHVPQPLQPDVHEELRQIIVNRERKVPEATE